jgi:glycosyltransferase involved in cell wall biosynthesis
MTRVAIVIDSLWIGGAQRLIATFAASASAYDITPIVVSLQDDSPSVILDSIRSAGVRALSVPSQSIFNLKRLRWLIKFFGDEGIDVVQTHLLYANILGTIAAHIAKIPVIATLHSTHVDKGWRISLLRQMENYILRHYATRILAVGNKVAVANQSFYGGRKVDVIPNGIPAPEVISLQARNQIRHDIAGDETRSIIITVGRF